MKKVFSIMVVLVTIFTVSLGVAGPIKASAQQIKPTGYLTKAQLNELNEVLENLRQEANKKLAKNITNFTVSSKVSFQKEPIALVFQENNNNNNNNIKNKSVLFSYNRAKEYSVYVSNGWWGFPFKHELFGSFIYKDGKVTDYTYDANLTGPFYSKSDKTTAVRLDPSVVRVTSLGTFQALKWAPVSYNTKIVVELYGSGTYRIIKTNID